LKVVLPDPWVALYAKTGAHYADEAVREQLIKVLDFKIERLWEHHAPIVITKTVTETVTVNSVSTTTVTLYRTVTEVKTEYVPVCAQRVRAYLPSEVNDVLKPYFKLKSLYQSVSNGTDYKALILKGAFQKNVFYMSELSSLVDVVLKINQLYGELNASLQTVKELLKEKPSLNVIFRIMDLIQRAKINIALIKSMISQADALERANGEEPSRHELSGERERGGLRNIERRERRRGREVEEGGREIRGLGSGGQVLDSLKHRGDLQGLPRIPELP